MKKIYFTLLMLIPFLGKAQTITTADIPTPGLAWITGNDSTYTQAIPAGGTSQVWDYSTLQNLENDTIGFISAAGTPYASLFPTSNLAGYDQASGTYSYFTSNSSGLYVDGIANASTLFQYDQSSLYIPVPFSYNDVRNATSLIQIDTVYTGAAVRLIYRTNSTFTADGSGNLTLPSGQFNNVLRIRETAISYDSILTDIGGGIYIPISTSISQVTRYTFLMPGNAVALLLGLEADSLGQFATSSSYFTGAYVNSVPTLPKGKSVSTYPNPASSSVNLDLAAINDVNLIEIYDTKGNLVLNITPNSSGITTFSALNLANGIYHFVVIGKNSKNTGSFQIQH